MCPRFRNSGYATDEISRLMKSPRSRMIDLEVTWVELTFWPMTRTLWCFGLICIEVNLFSDYAVFEFSAILPFNINDFRRNFLNIRIIIIISLLLLLVLLLLVFLLLLLLVIIEVFMFAGKSSDCVKTNLATEPASVGHLDAGPKQTSEVVVAGSNGLKHSNPTLGG